MGNMEKGKSKRNMEEGESVFNTLILVGEPCKETNVFINFTRFH